MKKRFVVAMMLVLTIVSSLSIPAYAATSDTVDKSELCISIATDTEEQSSLILPNTEPRYEDSLPTSRALTITVEINNPLESEWRSTYSSYYYEATRIVERADDYLADTFGIDFSTVNQPHWTFSTTSTGETAVEEALIDAMDKYGTGSADLMIAFAGPLGDTTRSTIYGAAYRTYPYAIIMDHDYYQNCKTTQHEVGHTYGLYDCSSSSACVMRQGPDTTWTWFEHLCTSHMSQWESAKDNYGG